ncbi:Phage capsid scaffolding protein (GPO) serine peptidase [Halopseudomonas litoralis]|uniref:Phage capsid scaffolding protein (GPO) serine peptidase n=1 Tax=Halopseudomonas litoralis TaxID=797277 RepID=A0A1H1SSG2_9GAMM|nr:GPO family capsid scaffolding protein [Halopseudomonas litoralis]SDS50339.1 Phage capsid scaffolding protein (GPO) serine peptidase [Halopseudomonas litoralis]
MKKKFRSKWFQVATEGATTDGRQIERSWIEEMAAQYDPKTYGARINCEHIKWSWPGGEFGAYGDVLALKAEEVEIGGKKKLALYAQIEPNEALLALNKDRQKIYTSIEVREKFADTGKAYLVGMAVTDSPASLGTEALAFSAQHGTLKERKTHEDNLFTAAEEAEIEFEETSENDAKATGIFKRVADLLSKSKEKTVKDDAQFSELTDAVEALANHASKQNDDFSSLQESHKAAAEKIEKLSSQLTELTTKLSNQADPNQTQRPPATGGGDTVLTQY